MKNRNRKSDKKKDQMSRVRQWYWVHIFKIHRVVGVAFDQDTLHSTQDTIIKWCSKKDEYNNC